MQETLESRETRHPSLSDRDTSAEVDNPKGKIETLTRANMSRAVAREEEDRRP